MHEGDERVAECVTRAEDAAIGLSWRLCFSGETTARQTFGTLDACFVRQRNSVQLIHVDGLGRSNSTVQRMTDNRMSGLALILGSAGAIITMALHPTGHDLQVPGQLTPVMHMVVAVHALALICLPIMFLGAWGLSRRLAAPNRISMMALVFYGFATVAVMNAAAVSGFMSGYIAEQMAKPDSAMHEMWHAMFHYNGQLNQAFAMLYVVAASVAILLWSAAMLKQKNFSTSAGIYGCILCPVTIVAVMSGRVTLGVHGFGMIVLCEAILVGVCQVMLMR